MRSGPRSPRRTRADPPGAALLVRRVTPAKRSSGRRNALTGSAHLFPPCKRGSPAGLAGGISHLPSARPRSGRNRPPKYTRCGPALTIRANVHPSLAEARSGRWASRVLPAPAWKAGQRLRSPARGCAGGRAVVEHLLCCAVARRQAGHVGVDDRPAVHDLEAAGQVTRGPQENGRDNPPNTRWPVHVNPRSLTPAYRGLPRRVDRTILRGCPRSS